MWFGPLFPPFGLSGAFPGRPTMRSAVAEAWSNHPTMRSAAEEVWSDDPTVRSGDPTIRSAAREVWSNEPTVRSAGACVRSKARPAPPPRREGWKDGSGKSPGEPEALLPQPGATRVPGAVTLEQAPTRPATWPERAAQSSARPRWEGMGFWAATGE